MLSVAFETLTCKAPGNYISPKSSLSSLLDALLIANLSCFYFSYSCDYKINYKNGINDSIM